jgi:hypothetical protein
MRENYYEQIDERVFEAELNNGLKCATPSGTVTKVSLPCGLNLLSNEPNFVVYVTNGI